VPVTFVDETNFRLGQWTAVQRRRHSIHKLIEERARRLESLPGWSWVPSRDTGRPPSADSKTQSPRAPSLADKGTRGSR
jgi:hypothetical protein